MATETRPGSISVATTYDGYARLTSYTRTGEAGLAHAYNGLDDCVATTRGTDTRRYVYDMDGRVIGEYGTSATDVKAEFIWMNPEVANDNQPFGGDDGTGGYAPLAVATGPTATPTLTWAHGTHLGVPTVYTDATGTATATPSGYDLPGFPGQSRTLADLYYNRYRDYDPTTGRYVQADPIGLDGDENPYVYAGADPVSSIDPMGLRKVIFFDPTLDKDFRRDARRERDIPGVCLVYGHMSYEGLIARVNGRLKLVTDSRELRTLLEKAGCRPKEPVYFLGCNAGYGPNPLAKKYADQNGVITVAPDRYTWWKGGFLGLFGRSSYIPSDRKYNVPDRNDPGRWHVFYPPGN